MRALLVVNQQATTTSRRSRDVLARALRSAVDLEVAYTRRRDHATTLAREAAAEAGLVVVHGGDGTVNEVVNGLLTVGERATDRPALAVVPGGSTNVFARALGLPGDWAEATGAILEALRDDRTRTIGLGRADDRYFTFCAGLGLDAAVVRRVEQARRRGRTSNPWLYARATARQFVADRRRPAPITVEVPGGGRDPHARLGAVATVIVQNTAPWTYLGPRPIDPNPEASFDLGLDVMALASSGLAGTARTFGQLLAARRAPHGRQVHRWHDLSELVLRSETPQPFQVDGDYLGEREKIQLTAAPEALRVCC
ncbi:diacylglycerol kinase family lipid kinase [Natronosporangium hydrolyticum]|uniref:Diacylglycerol kinase family lipid kinase n=1 Tax=Natronosporangium hydrolyticum TaxID=2811111 RepID=A0A895YNK2_9ACTN|nr:diacylglycerol kinase family protein [Natronosporangium hydrolyticum]QSB15700.1 diacylglycerol kinase family lipid kinase [Natronosporangium hydrolyticum]